MNMDNIQDQINEYIASLPGPKRAEMDTLHQRILQLMPECRLWFDDGKDDKGKTVCNPTIGYGLQLMKYANGKTKEFFRIGMSANTTGISIYILGLADKSYLAQTYAATIGKASVTGYCIKFKALRGINVEVLEAAILYGAAYAE